MAEQLRRVRISVPAAVVMIFVFVSSGAFGLEDMASSGAGMMVLMLVALPVLWALPMALVCSELGSALPEEGGYYAWVRRAMGEFWGFQCGWWAWTCQFVDSAVYIALILGYVGGWWPQLNGWELWLIGAALIGVFAWINIRGLDLVALSSIIFTVIIVAPFIVMTVLGFAHWHGTPLQPFLPSGETWWSSIGLGLAVGVWMYSGFDSMSTIAGEIERPRFVIPRALMISVPIIIASYLLPDDRRPRRRRPLAELDGRRQRRRHLLRPDGADARRPDPRLPHAGLGRDQQHGALPGVPGVRRPARLRDGGGPAAAEVAHEHPPQVRHAVGVDPAARGREPGAHHRHASPTSS